MFSEFRFSYKIFQPLQFIDYMVHYLKINGISQGKNKKNNGFFVMFFADFKPVFNI